MLGATFAALTFLAVIAWLWRLKSKDAEDSARVLGLARVPRQVTRGTTPEGFAYTQSLLLGGTLEGLAATVGERSVRRPGVVARRGEGSQLTVLTLTPTSPPRARFRLQPRGVLRMLEVAMTGDATPIVTDPAFDEAYHVYTDDPVAALSVLTPQFRRDLLAFRANITSADPSSVAARLSSGLVLGSFEVGASTVSYSLFGSPTKTSAEHLAAVAPLLARLAR